MNVKTAIIVADYAFVNGGNGQVGLSSALALARAGIHTMVLAATGPVDAHLIGVPLLEVICLDQSDFLNDSNRGRGALRGLWNFSAAQAMRTILAGCDPRTTVVHIHSWMKALSSSVARVANELSFPMVLTIHDYFTFCPNGSFYDHKKKAPCRLQPMSLACITANCDPRSGSQKAYRVARQFVTEHVGGIPIRVQNFIFVSRYSKEISERYLPHSARFFDVDNPIDVVRLPRVDVKRNELFAFVGRLSPEKGADIFSLAAKHAGAKALFVGDGPIGPDIRAGFSQAEYTGWVPHTDVQAHLRRARALVLPSRWYEASPLVVPEALALGIPVIVSDVCAARYDIVDGVTGLTFRSGDEQDLSRKLRALADPDLADHMGSAAYEAYWARPSSMDRHIVRLVDVYDRILTPA